MNKLEIKDLRVCVGDKEILKGINLTVEEGHVTVLMGPNGSGKSTLSNAIMGHPKYRITKGQIIFNGEDITHMPVHERAKKGLFLSFQYPQEITGVSVSNFLRTALNAISEERYSPLKFRKYLAEKMELLKVDPTFVDRYLNEGFSGGEKKRAEILQMAVLNPKLAVLDETDSGLDVDSLKIVAEGINKVRTKETGILLITHYQRILNYIKPDKVYIMVKGKIAVEGESDLVEKLEAQGYDWVMEKE